MKKRTWSSRRFVALSAAIVVVVIAGAFVVQRQVHAVAAPPACPAAEARALAASPVGHGVCVALGLAPTQMVEDDTIGRALIYNTWNASASIVDVTAGTVVRTVPLGSRYDFPFADVDTRTHHFFLSLQRGMYSTGGGNQVYMLDARSGAVLRALAGVAQPAEVVVDAARGHVFVADTLKSSVLMYDTRSGALLRAVPSCQDTELLALSTSTGHLFVRCVNGVVVMHDAATGRILDREFTPTSTMNNSWRTNAGVDTGMVVNDKTHALFIANLAAETATNANASLYDTRTGHLIDDAVTWRGFVFADEVHGYFLVAQSGNGGADQLVVLDGRTGGYLNMLNMPGPNVAWVQLNRGTGHLLVVLSGPHRQNGTPTGPGTLNVLDMQGGTVLRSIPIGLSPQAMFLDTRANRAGVLNLGWWPRPGSLTLLPLGQL